MSDQSTHVSGNRNRITAHSNGWITMLPPGPPIPRVGHIVHYVSHGTPVREDGTQAYAAQCRAAIVTEVRWPDDAEVWDSVGLAVLNPTGIFLQSGIAHIEREPYSVPIGGTWHWPEHV